MSKETMMQQRQQQQQVMEPAQIREHLTELQKWREAPGMLIRQQREAYATRIIEQEKIHNESFLHTLQEKMQIANAVGAVDNAQPLQNQQPAQETYKERREREKRAKKANKICPGADHISMDISEQVKAGFQWHHNSMEAFDAYKRAEELGVDKRVLRNFTYGYRKDKHGRPLTKMDERRKEADRIFIEDYLSCDLERRRKHLDRMTEQLIAYSEIFSTRAHFTLGYISKHARQAFDYGNYLTYYENVMKDPINEAYFNGLSKEQKTRLRIVQHDGGRICTFFSTFAGTKGIDMNSGEFLTEISDSFPMQLEFLTPLMEETITNRERMWKKFVEKQAHSMMKKAHGRIMEAGTIHRQKAEKMVNDDLQGLQFTTFATIFSFDELSKYRKMIEANPENYQKNQQIIDKLYQGLHHLLDSLGDLNAATMAWQEVLDATKFDKESMEKRRIAKIAETQEDVVAVKADVMTKQIASHTDALQHLLKNKPLSSPAERLLRNLGHIE